MLTTDRRAQILEILRQNGSVTVSKLAVNSKHANLR